VLHADGKSNAARRRRWHEVAMVRGAMQSTYLAAQGDEHERA
jgi:hypothetical protein